jgi:hypothetical protein
MELNSGTECNRRHARWPENQGLISDGGCCIRSDSVAYTAFVGWVLRFLPLVCEVVHSPPCNTEVKNAPSTTAISPCILLFLCLIKYRYNIPFTWSQDIHTAMKTVNSWKGNDVQVWRLVLGVLNMQLWTAVKGWFSSFGLIECYQLVTINIAQCLWLVPVNAVMNLGVM